MNRRLLILAAVLLLVGCISSGGPKPTPIVPNIAGVEWGFHIHPQVANQGLDAMPGRWVVAQIWSTEWNDPGLKETILANLKTLSGAGKKIVVRIEDPSVYSDDFQIEHANLSAEWYASSYGFFLDDVIRTLARNDIEVWGVQPFNEPFLNRCYVRGANGARITPSGLYLFHQWVRQTLDVLNVQLGQNVQLVSAAMTNFNQSDYRNLWRETLTPEFLATVDVIGLHLYSTSPGSLTGSYAELKNIIGNKPVFLGEVGALSTTAPDLRVQRITEIVSMLRNAGLNIVGACIYSWQEPSYSETPGWTARGTAVETFVRESED